MPLVGSLHWRSAMASSKRCTPDRSTMLTFMRQYGLQVAARGLAGRAQPPVDRDVADAQELGDHALAGVAHGVEQDRQGLHGLGLAALRRGGEVAAAGLAEVALVAPYRAVLDERRPGAPLAAHLDQPCPPDPAVEPSYQTVDLWVNVSTRRRAR